MDFKGFKKISEDKDQVIMKHDKGHTLTMALKALPKIQREQIKRLPLHEGGPVNLHDGEAKAFMDRGGQDVGSSQKVIAKDRGIIKQKFQDGGGVNPVSEMAQAPVNPQIAQPAENVNLLGPQDQGTTLNAPKAVNLQQQAQREQQSVDQAKGAEQANIEQGYINAQSKLNQQAQDNLNIVKKPTEDFKAYNNDHPIDENHYFEKMGTGEKVATAFGLMFGGFGQGAVGGSNPAMDFLNNQINRDIEGQRSRVDQQKTVLGAYQNLYGNTVLANNAAKVSMNDIYVHKGYQLAAKLGTPQAKATADAFAAAKGIENNQLLLDSSGRLGQLNGASPDQPQGAPGIEKTSAPGQAPEQPQEGSSNYILAPDAEKKFKSAQYDPSVNKNYGKMTEQYNNAVQAEKALKAIDEKFPELKGESTYGNYLASHVNPHAVGAAAGTVGALIGGGGLGAVSGGTLSVPGAMAGAGLGAGIGEGAGVALKGLGHVMAGKEGIKYDADKASLAKIISVALKNAPVNSSQVEEIIQSNTPNVWDNNETYMKKIGNIREFIKQNTDTSLLDAAKISQKQH